MRGVAVLVFFAVALTGLPAPGDVVHMADGTTREGRVLEANDKEVVLEVGQGGVTVAVRLPRSQVVKVEEKASTGTAAMGEYVSRLSKALKSTSADDWHALGLWCRGQRGFRDKAAEAFDRALALDPNHAPTRLVLGHVRINDAWMTREQAIRLIAPDLEANAQARELELQKEIEEARTAAAEAEARNKALEAKLAELRRDIEDLRARLTLPPLPADYYRPRVLYRPLIIIPRLPHPHHPGPPPKKDPPKDLPKDASPKDPSPQDTSPKNASPKDASPNAPSPDGSPK